MVSMKHLFERLGRLARAEFNSLSDRGSFGREAHGGSVRYDVTADEPPPATPYPLEIRQAYAALEIPLGSDRVAVRRGYRDMLRRYHPDLHQGDPDRLATATTLSQHIKEAHDRLIAWLDAG